MDNLVLLKLLETRKFINKYGIISQPVKTIFGSITNDPYGKRLKKDGF